MSRSLGVPVPDWKAPPSPPRHCLVGRTVELRPLSAAQHGPELFAAFSEDEAAAMWDYLPFGPYQSEADLTSWLQDCESANGKAFYALIDSLSGQASGIAAYLRIQPEAGSIEVGNLAFSPRLQRSVATTEAMYLMMRNAFELGYRRYEWKCNSLNEASKAAALRLGFQFEGVFRQAAVLKGRNRDTVWYSILDGEWPSIQAAMERWLSVENFGHDGQQKTALGAGQWR